MEIRTKRRGNYASGRILLTLIATLSLGGVNVRADVTFADGTFNNSDGGRWPLAT